MNDSSTDKQKILTAACRARRLGAVQPAQGAWPLPESVPALCEARPAYA